MEYVLRMENISKHFPGVLANDGINLFVKKGEIHALLGENGAGKSTLMNILYGLFKQDAGEIYVKDRLVELNSPNDAINCEIGMVHQHFMLIQPLTVLENIILGLESDGMVPNFKKCAKKISTISQQYKMSVDPYSKISELTVGQQQKVEILKVLYRGAKILILDEPTAVLTPQETNELFSMVKVLTNEGYTVLFITHKLNEIKNISDRVTVLRQGKYVATVNTCDVTKADLARMMVGRNVCFTVEKATCKPKEKVLEVKNISAYGNKNLQTLKDVSFDICEGEIFGIAGVDGNGQSELVEVLTGLRKASDGKVLLNQTDITNNSPREIFEHKVAHIPEDRQIRGLVLEMTLQENFIMQNHYQPPFSKGVFKFLNREFIKEHSCRLIEEYDIRTPSENALAQNLSGGNQQKLILAREIWRNPDLLIAMHPTRGLDVGAIEFVHKKIIEQRENCKAVLLVSTELDEILCLSDRIAVMYEGRIMGIVKPEEVSFEEIGLMMAGSKAS